MSLKILGIFFATLLLAAPQAELESRLAAAIHKETVSGDLEGAAKDFQSIAADSGQNRAMAVTALTHAAAAFEKLGRASEAQALRQRITRDYGNSAPITAQSLTRSSAMTVAGVLVQPQPRNLSFTEGATGSVPEGWLLPKPLADAGYTAELRRTGCGTQPSCAVLINPPKPVDNMFGILTRTIDAAPFRGKMLRLRSRLRVEAKAAGDTAHMFLSYQRPNKETGALDTMENRPVVTAAWTDAEIVAPISADAQSIMLGVMAKGSGRVWVEGMTLEIVPDDTERTTVPMPSTQSFGVARGNFPVSAAAGKTIKFSGYIKTEGVTQGYAGLWWRADIGYPFDKGYKSGAFDNMKDRGARGTATWTRYELQLNIPKDTTNIDFGIIHPGNGTAWFDSLAVEIDGVPYHDATGKFDFDFEIVKGFYTGGSGYEIGLDTTVAHSGRSSLKSRLIAANLPAQPSPMVSKVGLANFSFPITDARGKQVRFSGYIKTQNVTNGYAGMWWRVDGERDGKRVTLAFDNMMSRKIGGTSDWRRFDINLPVAADATNINFGLLLTGQGTAWFDGLTIDLNGVHYVNKNAFDLEFPGTTVPHAYTGGEGYQVEIDRTMSINKGGRSLRMSTSNPLQ